MNGQQHFREAERLIELTAMTREDVLARTHLAMTHALLALTGAVAGLDATEGPGGGSATGRSIEDTRAWDEVLGVST